MDSRIITEYSLEAQIWFTEGGVAEYGQLDPVVKWEYTELRIGWLLVWDLRLDGIDWPYELCDLYRLQVQH